MTQDSHTVCTKRIMHVLLEIKRVFYIHLHKYAILLLLAYFFYLEQIKLGL
jgi:hypothetical protein